MENFQETIIKKLHSVGCKVKYRAFDFVDGSRINFSDISKSHTAIADKLSMLVEYAEFSKNMGKGERTGFWSGVHQALKDIPQEEKKEPIVPNTTGLQLLVDKMGGVFDCAYLYDTEKEEMADLTWAAFEKIYSKKDVVSVVQSPVGCDFIFNPNKPKLEIDEDTGDWIFNKYVPPIWMKSEVAAHIPEFINTLINHLFTSEISKEYALKWLYVAMTSRCSTYLVLNSYPGVGKGVFEAIARALVGWNNSDEPSSGFLAEKFNTIMENKKLLVLDEIKVTEKSRDKLKRYVNSKISFEGKGSNARSATTNFCSFIISNNEVTDVHLKWNDRRFAVMDVTKVKFNTIVTDEITNRKVVEFEDGNNEEIAAFGKWLISRFAGKEVSVYPVPPSDHFYNLVEVSLHEWQKLILEQHASGKDKVALSKLREKSKELGLRFPANVAKIITFLKSYKHGPNEEIVGRYDVSAAHRIVFKEDLMEVL